MKLALTLVLAAAALVAGCAAPANTPEKKPDAPSGAAASAEAAASAASASTAASAAATGGAGAPTIIYALVKFDGKVPQYAEACGSAPVAFQCVDAPPTTDWAAMRNAPQFSGVATGAHLKATWTASSPSSQQLVLFAYSGSSSHFTSLGWKMGASPIEWAPVDWKPGAGETVYVGVAVPSNGEGSGGVFAWGSANPVEQPFHVEGTITALQK